MEEGQLQHRSMPRRELVQRPPHLSGPPVLHCLFHRVVPIGEFAQFSLPRFLLDLAQPANCLIVGDAIEPCGYFGPPLEAVRPLPYSDKDLLQQILRDRRLVNQAEQVVVERLAISLIQLGQSLFIPACYLTQQLLVPNLS